MTHQEMAEMADCIAKESPSTMLKALRDNGFWLYTINTVDVETAVEQSPKNEDLLPISDDDISYINRRDRVSDVVNYEDIINEVILEIRDYRISKDDAK
jgi:hypothetical protein